jgi:hypothetical protein
MRSEYSQWATIGRCQYSLEGTSGYAAEAGVSALPPFASRISFATLACYEVFFLVEFSCIVLSKKCLYV